MLTPDAEYVLTRYASDQCRCSLSYRVALRANAVTVDWFRSSAPYRVLAYTAWRLTNLCRQEAS